MTFPLTIKFSEKEYIFLTNDQVEEATLPIVKDGQIFNSDPVKVRTIAILRFHEYAQCVDNVRSLVIQNKRLGVVHFNKEGQIKTVFLHEEFFEEGQRENVTHYLLSIDGKCRIIRNFATETKKITPEKYRSISEKVIDSLKSIQAQQVYESLPWWRKLLYKL